MTDLPLVTVLVPARNEQADIERCLGAIAAQDYPMGLLEVLVVDGCSHDGTDSIARGFLCHAGFATTAVLSNEAATTPSNLNLGLRRATGEVICRVDARTVIEPHHVRTCVAILTTRPDVAVVGGAQLAVPRDRTAKAVGIARALNNRWSMGGSPYRRSSHSGPSDTVYLGAFRRRDLLTVGGWDERLPTNQDFDLNQRMASLGGIWFESSLRSAYVPRSSLALLWIQYRRFGRWKVRYWRLTGTRPSTRQRVLLGVPLAASGLGLVLLRRLGPLPTAVGMGVGAAALDITGSRESASFATRAMATVATVAVVAGWWTGVITELVASRGDGAATAAE